MLPAICLVLRLFLHDYSEFYVESKLPDSLIGTWKIVESKTNGKIDDISHNLTLKISATTVHQSQKNITKEYTYKYFQMDKLKILEFHESDSDKKIKLLCEVSDGVFTLCFSSKSPDILPVKIESTFSSDTILLRFKQSK